MRYRVAWKSRLTGIEGHGEWSTDRSLIEAWVEEGNSNKAFADALHWLEVEPRAPMPEDGAEGFTVKLPAWKGLYVDLSGLRIDDLPSAVLAFPELGPLRFIIGPRGYPWIW